MRATLAERLWGKGGARLIAGDAVVVGLLAAGVAALAVPRGGDRVATEARVEVAGRQAATIDLGRDGVTEVQGPRGETRVEVRDGAVRVASSPCPRQVCRHGGWVDEAGGVLVCLPNQVVVRLPGRRPPGATDGVSR